MTRSNARHQAAYRARQRDMLEELGQGQRQILTELQALRKAFEGEDPLRKVPPEEPAPPVSPPGKSTPVTSEPVSNGASRSSESSPEAPAGISHMDPAEPGEVARCQACRTPYLYVPPEPWECCGARDFVEDSLGADEIAVAVPV